MPVRPDWYSEHPSACTCASCVGNGRAGRRRVVTCTMCMGTGKTISRWSEELGGKLLRCPKCFGSGRVTRHFERADRPHAAAPDKPGHPGGVLDQAEEIGDKYTAESAKPPQQHTQQPPEPPPPQETPEPERSGGSTPPSPPEGSPSQEAPQPEGSGGSTPPSPPEGSPSQEAPQPEGPGGSTPPSPSGGSPSQETPPPEGPGGSTQTSRRDKRKRRAKPATISRSPQAHSLRAGAGPVVES